ncbi:UNKNOWN [Stylonychia lemnae]|uniref:Uncharacterized protein n=1 Tax=Stylonychia lemnae TaxID=5949 RepID=A0A078B3B3_STYLE|nr:UNKNOWN [Stylonychia lemnae]|eukprot:CDW89015.1 UNKNOWN [Stylonychia lemnae]
MYRFRLLILRNYMLERGNNTASNRRYIDTTLTFGKYCIILLQNGISAGSGGSVTWFLNGNSTVNVFKRSQLYRSILGFTDATLYDMANYGVPIAINTSQSIQMGGSDLIILVNPRTTAATLTFSINAYGFENAFGLLTILPLTILLVLTQLLF